MERLKKIAIRIFERDIFSILLAVTSTETRRKNKLFTLKFELHDKKSPMGPNNLFDLYDFELWEFKL